MGPNDPFARPKTSRRSSNASGAMQPSPPTDDAGSAGSAERPLRPRGRAAAAGFGAGLLFGVLVLVFGFGAALLVLLLGGLGAAVGWLGYGVATGQLDPAAAWRALRRE